MATLSQDQDPPQQNQLSRDIKIQESLLKQSIYISTLTSAMRSKMQSQLLYFFFNSVEILSWDFKNSLG